MTQPSLERRCPVPFYISCTSVNRPDRKRQTLMVHLSALLLLICLSLPALATDAYLQTTSDLHEDGALADRSGLPILLLVSRERCSYCQKLKREVLDPIQLSGQYKDQVIMREILIDPGRRLKDFHGYNRQAVELARGYGVSLTPTLLFLDAKGRELTTRMVGINTLEMFSFYLDEAIAQAAVALHRQ